MLIATLVVSAVLAAGPRPVSMGVRANVGTSHELGERDHAGFASTRFTLGMEMSSVFDLDLSYGFAWREGRTFSHVVGAVGRIQVGGPFEVEISAFGAPLGRRETGPACFTIRGVDECADVTEERFAFLSPGLGLVYTSDPEQDVVLSLNPSAEMSWYHLNYRILSGARAGQDRGLTIQELRVGAGLDLTFFERLGLGVRGDVFLHEEADPEQLPRTDLRAPAEQPFVPREWDVSPYLSWAFTPMVSAQVSGSYAPYQNPCFGHNRLGTLRLTVQPGRWRIFGQGTYEVDASPRDEATLELCGLPGPLDDFLTISFGVGTAVAF